MTYFLISKKLRPTVFCYSLRNHGEHTDISHVNEILVPRHIVLPMVTIAHRLVRHTNINPRTAICSGDYYLSTAICSGMKAML